MAVLKAWETYQSVLVVLPTGTGKSFIFSELVRRNSPKRALVLANRGELLFQAARHVQRAGLETSIEKAELSAPTGFWTKKPVVVASVQTLISREGLVSRMHKFNPMEFGLIVCDEADLFVAPSFQRILNYFKHANPQIKIFGCTATPKRADEIALKEVFETCAYKYEVADAISDGWLVPIFPLGLRVEGLDFSHIRTTAGELNGADLAKVMEAEKPLYGIAQGTLESVFCLEANELHGVGVQDWSAFLLGTQVVPRSALVFTVSVKHAEMLCGIFNRVVPGVAAWVCGKTKDTERDSINQRFKTGACPILVNCGTHTTGFDAPLAEIIVPKPTKSWRLMCQMIGRGFRPAESGGRSIVDLYATADERKAAIAKSRKPRCIAEGTLILTDIGTVPIEKITSEMKVWDGIEFVNNNGIIFHGHKKVISYAGLEATEDHQVWTEKGWVEFGECASKQIAIASTGIGRSEIWETEGYFRRGYKRETPDEYGIPYDGMRLRDQVLEAILQLEKLEGWMPTMRKAQKGSKVALGSLLWSKTKMREQQIAIIPTVREAWHKIQLLISERYGDLGSGQPGASSQYDFGPEEQRWPLRAGQFEVHDESAKLQQQTGPKAGTRSPRFQNSESPSRILRRYTQKILLAALDLERDFGSEVKGPKSREVAVFDILNAGPRHRFTANDLLVKNCIVLDFHGVTGKHKLITPFDILGGRHSPEAVALAIQRAREKSIPVNVTDEMAAAEEELRKRLEAARLMEAQRKSNVLGRTRFIVTTQNLFDKSSTTPMRMIEQSKKQVSEGMAKVLRQQGVRDPYSLPYPVALAKMREGFKRWKKNKL